MNGVVSRLRLAAPQAVVPVGAVLVALLVGAVVMLSAGVDPLRGYDAMVRGALGVSSVDFSVAAFTAILAMSLAFALPARMGEYNLGGDGQLCVGGIAAAVVALHLPLPAPLLLPACLLAAVAAGALLAALSAPLTTRARVPVIISTLLLSTPAVALTSYLVRFPLADEGSGIPQTPRFPDAAHLPALPGTQYTNLGLLLVVLVLVVVVVVDGRTSLGFELRAVGANRGFARYGGVSVPGLTLGALASAGGIAGLAGAVVVMTQPFRFIDGALTAPGYTFAGVAAALLAGGRPALLPLTAALFTVLQVGSSGMERDIDLPRQLGQVLQAVVILVLALRTVAAAATARRARRRAPERS
ncbi:ABC transporter permease [Kineococcus sp. SYSU DK002]|uniref:ABC transporter permease n=1 Tax=Kineococcus sp. SYSU DK002 TaxID=3383123 RepID=UPI003D7CC410